MAENFMEKGKFIVFYGVNNLGKTTQAKLLVKKFGSSGKKAGYIKYPVYELEPSGVMLNEYLRAGNPRSLSACEAQLLYAMNRAQYEPILKSHLEQGINVVAEDYWGTGVSWGVGAGVDKDFLLKLNGNFLKEDLALLFTGQRFAQGIEGNHLHETDREFTERVAKVHQELAEHFGWKLINANDTVENVSKILWHEVEKIL